MRLYAVNWDQTLTRHADNSGCGTLRSHHDAWSISQPFARYSIIDILNKIYNKQVYVTVLEVKEDLLKNLQYRVAQKSAVVYNLK